jgi:hypothetical protein
LTFDTGLIILSRKQITHLKGDMINMEFVPNGVQVFTNTMGIEIMVHPDGDKLHYRYFNEGEPLEEAVEADIKHSEADEYSDEPYSYFEVEGENLHGETIRFILDEFMRIDMQQTDRHRGIRRDKGRR